MSRLSTYRSKRDFGRTPEPKGARAKPHGKALRFIIQRHDATRLHYDFRIEMDGVLKSWAVTKVPSPDPATKRLAVEVEDHPLEYGTFEGTIPEGEYGGGTVQMWDRGIWQPQSDRDPARDLADGHLKMILNGERLKGGWALVRMRDRPEDKKRRRHNWLLIKEHDEFERPGKPDALLKEDTSIKTGRTLDEIAKKSKAVWNSDADPPHKKKTKMAKKPVPRKTEEKKAPRKSKTKAKR